MKKVLVLGALALALHTAPAFALGESYSNNTGNSYNPYQQQQQQQYPNPYQQQQQYQNPYQQQQPQYQQPQQQISGMQLNFNNQANNAARTMVIQGDPELNQQINSRQMRARDLYIARADLNGDGNDDIMVYNRSPRHCSGDQCEFSAFLYVPGQPLRPLMYKVILNPTIIVANTSSRGVHDLIVYDAYGQPVQLMFDGRQYSDRPQGYTRQRRGW